MGKRAHRARIAELELAIAELREGRPLPSLAASSAAHRRPAARWLGPLVAGALIAICAALGGYLLGAGEAASRAAELAALRDQIAALGRQLAARPDSPLPSLLDLLPLLGRLAAPGS